MDDADDEELLRALDDVERTTAQADTWSITNNNNNNNNNNNTKFRKVRLLFKSTDNQQRAVYVSTLYKLWSVDDYRCM